ncbi:MAG: hypothetical protein R3E96_12170, partial [Planctomycetota bacterium]
MHGTREIRRSKHLEWGEDWDLGELALQRKADITLDRSAWPFGRRAPTEVTLECLETGATFELEDPWTMPALLWYPPFYDNKKGPAVPVGRQLWVHDPIPGQSSDQRHADSSFDVSKAQGTDLEQSVEITAPGRYVWHYRLAEGHQQFPFQWDGVRPSLYFAPSPKEGGIDWETTAATESPSWSIDARLQSLDGSPVTGVEVAALPWSLGSTVTGPDGRFALRVRGAKPTGILTWIGSQPVHLQLEPRVFDAGPTSGPQPLGAIGPVLDVHLRWMNEETWKASSAPPGTEWIIGSGRQAIEPGRDRPIPLTIGQRYTLIAPGFWPRSWLVEQTPSPAFHADTETYGLQAICRGQPVVDARVALFQVVDQQLVDLGVWPVDSSGTLAGSVNRGARYEALVYSAQHAPRLVHIARPGTMAVELQPREYQVRVTGLQADQTLHVLPFAGPWPIARRAGNPTEPIALAEGRYTLLVVDADGHPLSGQAIALDGASKAREIALGSPSCTELLCDPMPERSSQVRASLLDPKAGTRDPNTHVPPRVAFYKLPSIYLKGWPSSQPELVRYERDGRMSVFHPGLYQITQSFAREQPGSSSSVEFDLNVSGQEQIQITVPKGSAKLGWPRTVPGYADEPSMVLFPVAVDAAWR